MRILGIDPGYERLGVAIVEKRRPGNENEKVLYSSCIQTSKNDPFSKRLLSIGRKIRGVIKEYKPSALAVERGFFNTNQKTAMGVSETRGVIVYEASMQNVPVFEYTPSQIKLAVTGYGRGTKKQVADMVVRLTDVSKNIRYDDEFDAIAVCITHLAQTH